MNSSKSDYRKLIILILIILPLNLGGKTPDTPKRASIIEQDESYPECRVNPIEVSSFQYKDYDIRISRAGESTCGVLNIFKNRELVYHREDIGNYFYLGDQFGDPSHFVTSPMFNLTSSINQELLISEWTGGAHCCFLFHIFRLDDHFKKLTSVEGGNFYPELEDVDGDGVLEIKIEDDFLAYIFADFSRTAVGKVFLKYLNGRFAVDSKHMKNSVLSHFVGKEKIESWRRSFRLHNYIGDAPDSLIQEVTDLFYNGNKDIALDLVNRSWPKEIPGKDRFLDSYKDALKNSKFYPEFEESY